LNKQKKMTASYFVGVDVGGTNTDAVLCRGENGVYSVVAARKAPSVREQGVVEALRAVLVPEVEQSQIAGIFIGTTQFINAVVERRHLSKVRTKETDRFAKCEFFLPFQVFVLRLTTASCNCVPPFASFPADLRPLVDGGWRDFAGGAQVDGSAIAPLDEAGLRQFCETNRAMLLERELVLIGTFACSAPAHELAAERVVLEALGAQASVTVSHRVGTTHFLKRENAAILNAALRPMARGVLGDFERAFRTLALGDVPAFITGTDGCAMRFEFAALSPVAALLSGPTNSMRGAALVANRRSCFVVDIGGTTSDCGFLDADGLPQLAHVDMNVGGVVINSRAALVRSIALGGGTMLADDGRALLATSVGSELTQRARLFGGDVATLSDSAVAARWCQAASVGAAADAATPPLEHAAAVMESAARRLEQLIDEMKTSAADTPVLLVGGGAALFEAMPRALRGASAVERPPFASVANAIGAALAQVSAVVDKSLVAESREAAVAAVRAEAIDAAVARGAARESVRVVACDVATPSYSTSTTLFHVVVKVVGDFVAHHRVQHGHGAPRFDASAGGGDNAVAYVRPAAPAAAHAAQPPLAVAARQVTQPIESLVEVRRSTGSAGGVAGDEWVLDEEAIANITVGCGVLGCGGGGNAMLSEMRALDAVRRAQRQLRVATVEQWLSGALGDGVMVMCAFIGAPLVLTERLGSGTELLAAVRAIAGERRVCGVVSAEIGGMNGIEPIMVAAQLGVPVLDADSMGRAFPQLGHALSFMRATSAELTPTVMASHAGDVVSLSAADIDELEAKARVVVVSQFGGAASIAFPPLTAATPLVHGSISRAHAIGKAIRDARRTRAQAPVAALLGAVRGGKQLFVGSVCDIVRGGDRDFTRGTVTLRSPSDDTDRFAVVFKNENLVASHNGAVVVSAPDLIVLVEHETARPVYVDELAFGQRLCVLALPCDARYRAVPTSAFGIADIVPEAVTIQES
jgi:DUF917 family protein/N-methylhydantoinase A/oxoprolinase/acetone carboxylase beta subunit